MVALKVDWSVVLMVEKMVVVLVVLWDIQLVETLVGKTVGLKDVEKVGLLVDLKVLKLAVKKVDESVVLMVEMKVVLMAAWKVDWSVVLMVGRMVV